MKNNRGKLGVSTDLGRRYSETERDMTTALCLACPDLIGVESPKGTRAGECAPMDGMLMGCNTDEMTTEIKYIYEAKYRNFNAATLFGKFGGRALIGSVKLGNCQRASLLFGVPSLLLMRLQDEAFFLVKRLCNSDGQFTFPYNEKWMRTKQPCLSGYEEALQTFVPMEGAAEYPLEVKT